MAAPRPEDATTWSLTEQLLESNPAAYKAATQSPFLLAAAEGRLSKQLLGRWLANDKLYIHSYVKASGRLLDAVDLPEAPAPITEPSPESELVDWVADTLVGLRREERMFADVAHRYALDLALELEPEPEPDAEKAGRTARRVLESAKLPGLVQFQALFTSIFPPIGPARLATAVAAASQGLVGGAAAGPEAKLPWLEAAVILWGTERVYLDAWSWARARQTGARGDPGEDADGGAVRKEFIPNWSSPEFAAFVGRLGRILDRAVAKTLAGLESEETEAVRAELLERALLKWSELLAAEAAFWPETQ